MSVTAPPESVGESVGGSVGLLRRYGVELVWVAFALTNYAG
jgi:hypothetical protein